MSIQSWLNRIWYGRAGPPWWLVPGSLTYGALAASRRFLYRHRLRNSTRITCPVVIIGNLSVGGTGKTPLVCWLAMRLRERGFKPGVVTRGYGGSCKRLLLVGPDDDPNKIGDEALLLARRTGVPVAVGRDRSAAAKLLVGAGCDVVLSDDGLQHYALARDCEIVVVDGDRRFGNGWLLPAGPLRERPERMRLADAVVVNGQDRWLEGALRMRLEAKTAVNLMDSSTLPLSSFAGKSVHAIAGIGNPERFFKLLQSFGIEVMAHPLDDHARLQRSDIVFADDRPVLMTEKDAVKCAKIAASRHWQVPVNSCFDEAESSTLLATVLRKIAVRKRQTDEA